MQSVKVTTPFLLILELVMQIEGVSGSDDLFQPTHHCPVVIGRFYKAIHRLGIIGHDPLACPPGDDILALFSDEIAAAYQGFQERQEAALLARKATCKFGYRCRPACQGRKNP